RELEIGAPESGRRALAEAQGRRTAERDADHLLEHVAVAVPANARTGNVPSEQPLDEVVWLEAGEGGDPFPKRLQPVRNGLGGREARVLEIVAPAEALRPPVADEAVEAERRQFERLKTAKQLSLLGLADHCILILKPRYERRSEQQAHAANKCLSS